MSEHVDEQLIQALKTDKRKGVQLLLQRYEVKKQKHQELAAEFERKRYFEKKNYAEGKQYIAGVDEVGRGPLAGPVVAAAVILPKDFRLLGLDDSKKLSEAKRNSFYTIIKDEAISYGVAAVSSKTIDAINIYEATKLAMRKAIEQLNPAPDHILIDAVRLEGLSCSSESMPKGDQKSVSIAAASILAKVTRDKFMKEIHNEYPAYYFASNMGYGTKQHLDALAAHGITPYHRTSFAPVKEASR